MSSFIKKVVEFVLRPSHSRTLGLVLMLVLVAAVSLTVYVAQQQQETRQRAAEIDSYNLCFKEAHDEFETCQTNLCGEPEQPIDEVWTACMNRKCVPQQQARNIYCYSLLSLSPTPTPAEVAVAKPVTPTPNACAVLPDCGSGLDCSASSSCSGLCPGTQNKCLSLRIGFGGAEKYGGKKVVCCNVPPTPTPTQLASSSLCNPDCKNNEICTPYDDPGGITGYSCVRTPVVCGANNGQSFGTCTGSDICQQFGNSQFSDGIRYECVSAITPTPTKLPTPVVCGVNNGQSFGTCTGSDICQQFGNSQFSDGIRYECVSATTATPTPTKITVGVQCGTTVCNSNQICLVNQAGQGEGVDICVTPTPTAIACLKSSGDANCDGKINITDFNIWRDEFKKFTDGLTADFNKDGRITIVDFNILRDGLKNTNLPHQ